jgi:hypothetical protein
MLIEFKILLRNKLNQKIYSVQNQDRLYAEIATDLLNMCEDTDVVTSLHKFSELFKILDINSRRRNDIATEIAEIMLNRFNETEILRFRKATDKLMTLGDIEKAMSALKIETEELNVQELVTIIAVINSGNEMSRTKAIRAIGKFYDNCLQSSNLSPILQKNIQNIINLLPSNTILNAIFYAMLNININPLAKDIITKKEIQQLFDTQILSEMLDLKENFKQNKETIEVSIMAFILNNRMIWNFLDSDFPITEFPEICNILLLLEKYQSNGKKTAQIMAVYREGYLPTILAFFREGVLFNVADREEKLPADFFKEPDERKKKLKEFYNYLLFGLIDDVVNAELAVIEENPRYSFKKLIASIADMFRDGDYPAMTAATDVGIMILCKYAKIYAPNLDMSRNKIWRFITGLKENSPQLFERALISAICSQRFDVAIILLDKLKVPLTAESKNQIQDIIQHHRLQSDFRTALTEAFINQQFEIVTLLSNQLEIALRRSDLNRIDSATYQDPEEAAWYREQMLRKASVIENCAIQIDEDLTHLFQDNNKIISKIYPEVNEERGVFSLREKTIFGFNTADDANLINSMIVAMLCQWCKGENEAFGRILHDNNHHYLPYSNQNDYASYLKKRWFLNLISKHNHNIDIVQRAIADLILAEKFDLVDVLMEFRILPDERIKLLELSEAAQAYLNAKQSQKLPVVDKNPVEISIDEESQCSILCLVKTSIDIELMELFKKNNSRVWFSILPQSKSVIGGKKMQAAFGLSEVDDVNLVNSMILTMLYQWYNSENEENEAIGEILHHNFLYLKDYNFRQDKWKVIQAIFKEDRKIFEEDRKKDITVDKEDREKDILYDKEDILYRVFADLVLAEKFEAVKKGDLQQPQKLGIADIIAEEIFPGKHQGLLRIYMSEASQDYLNKKVKKNQKIFSLRDIRQLTTEKALIDLIDLIKTNNDQSYRNPSSESYLKLGKMDIADIFGLSGNIDTANSIAITMLCQWSKGKKAFIDSLINPDNYEDPGEYEKAVSCLIRGSDKYEIVIDRLISLNYMDCNEYETHFVKYLAKKNPISFQRALTDLIFAQKFDIADFLIDLGVSPEEGYRDREHMTEASKTYLDRIIEPKPVIRDCVLLTDLGLTTILQR